MLIKLEKKLFNIASSIYGYSILDLINISNYKYFKKYKLDKGFIGKLIEFFLIGYLNINKKGNICDLDILNLEIKILSFNFNLCINNDISLIKFNIFKFIDFFTLKKILLKFYKIMWIPIIGDSLDNKIIGKAFISKLNILNLFKIFNELNKSKIKNTFNKYFNNKINNIYTNTFRFQYKYNKDFININLFIRKSFIKNFIKKNNIIIL